jgi:glycerophosphoryl diester phosphodiesterase
MRTLLLAAILCTTTASAFDLQGHRGARGHLPENTLAGFRKALDIGVTTLETDVGITRDGVPVILHDRQLNPTLTRAKGGAWIAAPGARIRELAFAELRTFDVGRLDPQSTYAKQWPLQSAADGERIPSLDEFLDLVRKAPKPVRINVETKLSPLAPEDTVDPATFARVVVAAVKAAGLVERTTIQSFDWRTLVEAKKLDPAIRTGCLTIERGNGDNVKPDASGRSPWLAGAAPGNLPKMAKEAGCDTWSPFWRDAPRERIAEAKALGLAVVPWTVNERDEMLAVIDAGADGLITDYPDRARKVMAERGLPLP